MPLRGGACGQHQVRPAAGRKRQPGPHYRRFWRRGRIIYLYTTGGNEARVRALATGESIRWKSAGKGRSHRS